ncbi:MAG: hypothetical protein QXP36_14460 [Conexivisphaerales archaeon]
MNDEMKIQINEMINQIKNSDRLIEIYKKHDQTLEIFNNALMISYFKDSEQSEQELNNKIDKLVEISNQTLIDLLKKDFDIFDIFNILFLVLETILYLHPNIKDISSYFSKKLKEEVLVDEKINRN